ncbi:MAG: hypothetical protein R6X10_09140 [Desulfobacterales bacterium]
MENLIQSIKTVVADDDNLFLQMTTKIVMHNLHENVLLFESGKAALTHIEKNNLRDLFFRQKKGVVSSVFHTPI